MEENEIVSLSPLILTVSWDRQGMPVVNVLSGDEQARDVIVALELAQRGFALGLEQRLVEAYSEIARLRARSESEMGDG